MELSDFAEIRYSDIDEGLIRIGIFMKGAPEDSHPVRCVYINRGASERTELAEKERLINSFVQTIPTTESIDTRSEMFTAIEEVMSEYNLEYSATALHAAGYDSISEYIADNGGNPWALNGRGVILEVSHSDTIDYLETRIDTVEFYE